MKTYKRPIYSYGILYKVSKNKYSLTQGGEDNIRLSFTYTQEDFPEGFTTYVDNEKPTKLIKKLKQYPYEPVVVKCIIDGGVKFELTGDTYWSESIAFISEILPSYRNFSIIFREKPFSKREDQKVDRILQEQLKRDYQRSTNPDKNSYIKSYFNTLKTVPTEGRLSVMDEDLYKNNNKLRRKVAKKKFEYILANFKPKE